MCNLFQIIFYAKILSANNICPQNGKSGHLFAMLYVCQPRLFDRQMAGAGWRQAAAAYGRSDVLLIRANFFKLSRPNCPTGDKQSRCNSRCLHQRSAGEGNLSGRFCLFPMSIKRNYCGTGMVPVVSTEVRSRSQNQSALSAGSTMTKPQPCFFPDILHLCASECPSAKAKPQPEL